MRNSLALVAAAFVVACLAVPAASASRYIERGIFDDAQIHYGNPDQVFPILRTLKTHSCSAVALPSHSSPGRSPLGRVERG